MAETTQQETTEVQGQADAPRRRTHTRPTPQHNTIYKIRQILNALFMVLCIIGCIMYCGVFGDERTSMMGAIIAIIAVAMKMAECILRFIK